MSNRDTERAPYQIYQPFVPPFEVILHVDAEAVSPEQLEADLPRLMDEMKKAHRSAREDAARYRRARAEEVRQ